MYHRIGIAQRITSIAVFWDNVGCIIFRLETFRNQSKDIIYRNIFCLHKDINTTFLSIY